MPKRQIIPVALKSDMVVTEVPPTYHLAGEINIVERSLRRRPQPQIQFRFAGIGSDFVGRSRNGHVTVALAAAAVDCQPHAREIQT